jgi:hypothetical protein
VPASLVPLPASASPSRLLERLDPAAERALDDLRARDDPPQQGLIKGPRGVLGAIAAKLTA